MGYICGLAVNFSTANKQIIFFAIQ